MCAINYVRAATAVFCVNKIIVKLGRLGYYYMTLQFLDYNDERRQIGY